MSVTIRQIEPNLWEIPRTGGMRVPGRVVASSELMASLENDPCLEQVANVAHLPGIVGYSLAMPDIHWGYGFPIGGVAAMREDDGVISPGGVGYDINCGVRLAATSLRFDDVRGKVPAIVDRLFANVPCGVGQGGAIPKLSARDVRRVLERGAGWAVAEGYGSREDLEKTEENGALSMADPSRVSDAALERGARQLGTLGSGNHFLEIGRVDDVYDDVAAARFGLVPDGIVFMVHSGSRGLGYQVCDDFLGTIGPAMGRYGIRVPDRQLACAPLRSEEGQAYLAAMAAAANFAWANRQVIMALAARSFEEALRLSPGQLGCRLVYDVCHNIAKFETHRVDGRDERLCVHRKGATRAFGPRHREVPAAYRDLGQPVLVPGDMARGSFLLLGTDGAMERTFGSTCHGAGRVLSRSRSKKATRGRDLVGELSEQGVTVAFHGRRTLAEEMPEAYKNVADVVSVVVDAGLSRPVARFQPIGVIKG